jgi:hypothetical protein
MKNEKIAIEWYPIEHIERAYNSGFYIEAIQVMHAFIELEIRELIYLTSSNLVPHEEFELAYDSMFDISMNIGTKVLFIQGTLSKDERDKLTNFNKIRNTMVHQIFSKDGNSGILKEKFDEVYKTGLNLMEMLEVKMHSMIEKNSSAKLP